MSAAPIRVAVAGAAGRMGQTVCEAVEGAADMELTGRADPALDTTLADVLPNADVVVDFTTPDTAQANALACLDAGVHVVIGTTGFDPAPLRAAAAASAGNVLIAPNFAIGAVLMMRFATEAARHFPKAEIIELHHDRKLDAPSGTAARTASLMEPEMARPRADPLRPAARARRPSGGPVRRPGRDADDPPRLAQPAVLHARGAARRPRRAHAARARRHRARAHPVTDAVTLRPATSPTPRRSPRSACAAGRTRTPTSWTRACSPSARSSGRQSAGAAWLAEDATQTQVAEVGGRVIGYATVGASRDADATPAVGELAGLYVDPPAQGAGLGTRLLEDAIARLRSRGFARATLWVFEENGLGRAFYERHGWSVDPGGAGREGADWHGPALRYRRDL